MGGEDYFGSEASEFHEKPAASDAPTWRIDSLAKKKRRHMKARPDASSHYRSFCAIRVDKVDRVPIDILNVAKLSELIRARKVGPKLAGRIIMQRPFRSWKHMRYSVHGIGKKITQYLLSFFADKLDDHPPQSPAGPAQAP